MDLSLQTGATEDLIELALNREIEGAFVAGEVNNPELESIDVFQEELVLVSKMNVLSSADFEQLKNETFIVFKSGCFYRDTFEKWLGSIGIRPTKRMELNTLDGVIGCVRLDWAFHFYLSQLLIVFTKVKTSTGLQSPKNMG